MISIVPPATVGTWVESGGSSLPEYSLRANEDFGKHQREMDALIEERLGG